MTDLIQTVLIYALPVIFAITLHEAAHGYAAQRLGDNTAAMLGRVTLNPMVHIDPLGTIFMPLLLYFSTGGAFLFGYAKPVPVRFDRLRHPKKDMVWVALAGPASNLLQALLWGVVLYVLAGFGIQERFFLEMCRAGMLTNVVMFAFNLFPLPPLDGGRWTHFGRSAALAPGGHGFTHRALGLFHRHGAGDCRRRQCFVDAAHHGPDLFIAQACAEPPVIFASLIFSRYFHEQR